LPEPKRLRRIKGGLRKIQKDMFGETLLKCPKGGKVALLACKAFCIYYKKCVIANNEKLSEPLMTYCPICKRYFPTAKFPKHFYKHKVI